MKRTALTVLGMIGLALALLVGTSSIAKAEGTYWQTASGGRYIYINAWGEGPDVDVYGGTNDNDLFVAAYNPNNGYYELWYTGPGAFNDYCVSDYGNSSGDAKAQLNYCTGTIIPWGGNFEYQQCAGGGYSFYNVHWGRYLAGSGANGSHFYLNANQQCFTNP